MSGIQDSGFHDVVWYKREFTIPKDWEDKQIILHFGAVDYLADVFVNGQHVGQHEGGHTSFSFNITNVINKGAATIVVRAEDPSTDETIPRGKQFWQEKSAAIWYTRTTGIWQTVWLEPVEEAHIKTVRYTPNVDEGIVAVELEFSDLANDQRVEIDISFKGESVVNDQIQINELYTKRSYDLFNRSIFKTNFHNAGWCWTPENPNLFDVQLRLLDQDDKRLDTVDSYFGMRKIHTEDGVVYLNNKAYYQKLILDQGYWKEGLLTAPTDEAFRQDIELAKQMGFNGCRKHQKVEDPRFLYWADQLGFLVWGESASFVSYSNEAVSRAVNEWKEIIQRDYNHPSIVTWVPVNESWGVPAIHSNRQQQHYSQAIYHFIHSLDTTRLVISNDGWEMTETDICAIHSYVAGDANDEQKYEEFERMLLTKENVLSSRPSGRILYVNGFAHQGEPLILTEFGGIGFKVGMMQAGAIQLSAIKRIFSMTINE